MYEKEILAKKIISVVLALSVVFALASCAEVQKPDWQTSLDLGQKYLLDGNYEQAIVEFNNVIEIEPKNVEAYIGLAEAYAAQGDYDSAISVLKQGYAETGNQTLQDKINELRGLAASQTEAVAADVTTLPETTATPESIANQDNDSQIIKQVSIGGGHAAAITADGSLYMWGDNSVGQLGNGTTEDSYVPIKIMDNVVSVSLGNFHSAAITSDGSLYMWGDNTDGQLGNGKSGSDWNSYDEGIDSNVPIKIMDDVVYVNLGCNYSGAITKDGSLYMWGMTTSFSVLGNPSAYPRSASPIKIMDNVASVSLDIFHSAAITKDESLYMWGCNYDGQLGISASALIIYQPIKIIDNVVSVSIGDNHSAAITSDGSLYMWGSNARGQLGDGTTENSNVPVKIIDDVASISLGSYHSAAITTDGSLYMWGDNTYGQLGDGTTENSNIPKK